MRLTRSPISAVIAGLALLAGTLPAVAGPDRSAQQSTSGVERSPSGLETQGPNLAPRVDDANQNQTQPQAQQSAPVIETQGADRTPQTGEPVLDQTQPQAVRPQEDEDRDFPRLEIRGPNFAPHIVYD